MKWKVPGAPLVETISTSVVDLAKGRVGRHPGMADQVVEHGSDVDSAGGHVRTGDKGEDVVVTVAQRVQVCPPN